MSEKSPPFNNIAEKYHIYPHKENNLMKALEEVRNQTLAQVEEILDECIEEDCNCDTDYTLRIIRKEIKKIHSQGANSSGEYQKNAISDIPKDSIKDGETGFVNHKRCAPDTNTQNLKGCGKYIEDMDGVCGIDGLCEKCQRKMK